MVLIRHKIIKNGDVEIIILPILLIFVILPILLIFGLCEHFTSNACLFQ
jgi:hypothetical protein